MPSSYSDALRLELQAAGENSTTWGSIANTVFQLLEDSITKRAAVTMTDANYTLTTNNGSTDEARCMIIALSGTLTASRNVVCPTKNKFYIVHNNTTGGYSIVFKTTAGSGITVPNGDKMLVYCDGTNVVDAVDNLPSTLTIGGAAPYVVAGTDVALADGGTGASLADPNADRIMFWDDSGGAVTWLTAGTGLAITTTTMTLSHLGIEALTDPNADRIYFWDDSAGASAWLTLGTGLSISGTTLSTSAYVPSGTDVALADGGTGASLADPNADRIMFWDDSAGAVTWLAPNGFNVNVDTTTLYVTETWTVACSDETTALTTGTAKATFVFPYNVTVISVGCSVNTAGTGLTVDINESGVSILSTKLTLDSGEKTSLTAGVAAVISDTSITAGNEISIDIDTASGTSKGLKVWMIVRRTS